MPMGITTKAKIEGDVTGTLKEYNNKPEIIISKPGDIIIE